MNTRILIAFAGAVAFTACADTRTADMEEFPLIPFMPAPTKRRAPVDTPAPTPTNVSPFRVPNPTDTLYPLRTTGSTQPSDAPKGDPAFSVVPPTPVATPSE
jgi:hypothetical protein